MSLESVGNQRRAKPWRCTHKDMDMIDVRFQCQECESMSLTTFDNEPFRFCLHIPCQYLAAILGYPYQMIGYRVVGISGFTHL